MAAAARGLRATRLGQARRSAPEFALDPIAHPLIKIEFCDFLNRRIEAVLGLEQPGIAVRAAVRDRGWRFLQRAPVDARQPGFEVFGLVNIVNLTVRLFRPCQRSSLAPVVLKTRRKPRELIRAGLPSPYFASRHRHRGFACFVGASLTVQQCFQHRLNDRTRRLPRASPSSNNFSLAVSQRRRLDFGGLCVNLVYDRSRDYPRS